MATPRYFTWRGLARVAAALALALIWQAASLADDEAPPTAPARFAGPVEGGYLLPNGWTVTPVGEHVELTDMPLNIVPLGDGRRVLVATSGYNAHELSLVDLETKAVLDKEKVSQSWFGLVVSPGEDRVWWAGGGSNRLHTFRLAGNDLSRTSGAEVAAPQGDGQEPSFAHDFKSGLAIDRARGRMYSLDIDAGGISALSLDDEKPIASGVLGGRPYDVALSRQGTRLYVSDWAGRQVLAVDPESLRVLDKIAVGEHPNQIVPHPHDDRLFVACASSNSVAVIDGRRGVLLETIFTTLFPLAPEGSTPCAVAVAPDGNTLYVANADNNCVAVVDISEPGESGVKGFIPTGWYPVSLALTPDGNQLLVGVGKGLQTRPNPPFADRLSPEETERRKAERRALPWPYIGTTLSGALSILPVPDDEQLETYTEQVYRNCPYSDKLLAEAPSAEPTAVPSKVGDPSPIEYVIYIIKENRTYDQVFGDLPRGNGDPALCMFPEEVTPNHHKLANEFVLLDNLYCNGQVSRDGHPWSTGAYNTDYVARDWMLTYSGREGVDDDDERNLSTGPSGHIWDACSRAGLGYRSYGEYGRRVSQPDGNFVIEAAVPGLVGHISPDFGTKTPDGRDPRDTDRVEVFLREFNEFVEKGTLPRLMIVSLGEDHTQGTRPGSFTPQACVASNDLALGRLVEAVSHSPVWEKTAIFVIEDDAQNGPDHVDAHRTVGLAISPYVKRGALDSTQYTTVGMLRTIELILGLPPLSQFDAAATPMFNSFTHQADLRPYTHEPARIDLNATNDKLAYGAERSQQMDFSEYDRINDFELNEILWFAVMGPDAPQPAPVRRAIANRTYRPDGAR